MNLLVPNREYFIIPDSVNDTDLMVYALLNAKSNDGYVQISHGDIANHFRKSKHFSRDSIKRLSEGGLINVVNRCSYKANELIVAE